MKKKIISIALVLCFACGLLSSCELATTFSIMKTAMENTENLDSMNAEMKMEMNMSIAGSTEISIPMTADIKASGLKSDAPIMSTALSMSMFGQSIEMEMYQEGDWAYMVIEDMKYKTNVAAAENEYDYSDNVDAMLQPLPEDILNNVELIKNDDGSQTLTVSVPDDMFADIYDDFIDDVNSSSGLEGDEIKISDAVVKITIANEYISVYDMSFTMTMTTEGITSTTDVTASITFKDPGSKVTVTPPEGYKDFEELDLAA